MEQDIKKLVLGDCEVIDDGVIADIVKVNGIGFAPRTSIPTRQSAEEVEKAKTIINNIVTKTK